MSMLQDLKYSMLLIIDREIFGSSEDSMYFCSFTATWMMRDPIELEEDHHYLMVEQNK